MLRRSLQHVDWQELANYTDVNDAVAHYNRIISECIQSSVPFCQAPRKPPWSNARLRKLKRVRSSALRRYANRRCPTNRKKFTDASKTYRNLNNTLYKRYVLRTQRDLRSNPKNFWTFVNSKRQENGLPSKMFLNDTTATAAKEKCDLFAEHFASVFNPYTPTSTEIEDAISHVPPNVLNMDIMTISERETLSAIRQIKPSLVPGPSALPASVLKNCSDILAAPLTILFNQSLQQKTFPDRWKRSSMFPVFKKGDKSNVTNYRGITSLCVESKVLETLIKEALFTSSKHYISTAQHGFFPGRSVETNLAMFTSFCIDNISKQTQVDTIYTDLKAAFDSVNHSIILAKMLKLGCTARFCQWLNTYLTQRQLYVEIGDCKSELFCNSSGVPQGSNLGPLLFSIFVNDVTFVLRNGGMLLYADDLKIFLVIRSIEDCRELQRTLNNLNDWCLKNMLLLSVSKCFVITYHRTRNILTFDYRINDTALQRVDHAKDLGILLDEKLTFRSHYSAVIDKAFRQLGFIFKIAKEFRDPMCFKALYCSLVRSILEFGCVIWSPYHAVWENRLEAVQRRFARYALRHLPWRDPLILPPYLDRCRALGIESLTQRRHAFQAAFISKLLLGEHETPELLSQLNLYAPERALRPREMLQIAPRNTDYASNSPLLAMSRQFNNYEDLFDFNLTSHTFRRRILGSMTQ